MLVALPTETGGENITLNLPSLYMRSEIMSRWLAESDSGELTCNLL